RGASGRSGCRLGLARARRRVPHAPSAADRPRTCELEAVRIARHRRRVIELEPVREHRRVTPFERMRSPGEHEVTFPLPDRRIRPENTVHLIRIAEIELRARQADLRANAVERLLVLPPADVADEPSVTVNDPLTSDRDRRVL